MNGEDSMKESVQTAIRVETVLEVAPRLDFMYRFIFDQFFQQSSRRIPGQPLQFKKTDVKPGRQARFQFPVKHRQFPVSR